MSSLLFVYGTLKRGCSNHAQLAGQTFMGEARTQPGFALYDAGGYPGLVADPDAQAGIHGEVWDVTPESLRTLDLFEGVPEGLYRRAPIPLLPPFATQRIDAYFFAGPLTGRPRLGDMWVE